MLKINYRLSNWLKGTNWPDYYTYRHEAIKYKDRLIDKVEIRKGLDFITFYFDPTKLTRSDFDYAVMQAIMRIGESSKTTQRFDIGKEALKK